MENPARYRIMFGDVIIGHKQPSSLHEAASQAFAHLVSAIEQGQLKGSIPRADPREQAGISWSLVHGLAQRLIDGKLMGWQGGHMVFIRHDDDAPDSAIDRVIDLALDNIVSGLRLMQK